MKRRKSMGSIFLTIVLLYLIYRLLRLLGLDILAVIVKVFLIFNIGVLAFMALIVLIFFGFLFFVFYNMRKAMSNKKQPVKKNKITRKRTKESSKKKDNKIIDADFTVK